VGRVEAVFVQIRITITIKEHEIMPLLNNDEIAELVR
jgi:hypothetical protein